MTTLEAGVEFADLLFLGRQGIIATAILRDTAGVALIDPAWWLVRDEITVDTACCGALGLPIAGQLIVRLFGGCPRVADEPQPFRGDHIALPSCRGLVFHLGQHLASEMGWR